MELLALTFIVLICAVLYSIGSFVYFPLKLLSMKMASKDIWAFLTGGRLLLAGVSYLVAAPVPGLLAFGVSAGSVGGSHAAGTPDTVERFAWAFFFVCLFAAVLSLVLNLMRPKDRAAPAA